MANTEAAGKRNSSGGTTRGRKCCCFKTYTKQTTSKQTKLVKPMQCFLYKVVYNRKTCWVYNMVMLYLIWRSNKRQDPRYSLILLHHTHKNQCSDCYIKLYIWLSMSNSWVALANLAAHTQQHCSMELNSWGRFWTRPLLISICCEYFLIVTKCGRRYAHIPPPQRLCR